jgi:hypothetical protein
MRASPLLRLGSALVLVGAAAAVSGCGSAETTLADASGGTPFRVSAQARFDRTQDLSRTETLRITVTNEEDQRRVPDVGIVLEGLGRAISGDDNGAGAVSDPRRPIWIVDAPPKGASTAYSNTWSLGALPPGEQRTFSWRLTPVVPGKHVVRWRVVGGLEQAAPVKGFGGVASGAFRVTIAD